MRPILTEADVPPVWLVLHLVLAWGVSLISPPLFGLAGHWGGKVLIGLGVLVMAAALVTMTRAKTTVIPRRDPSALVTYGIFGWSRNPIYLADTLILSGAILWLDAPFALPLVASFMTLIRVRFIEGEEARLTAAFGPEFDLWAARVRRWFGRK
jgi:protein-S-isoprenylcysteine O-methyltransferase Ste14